MTLSKMPILCFNCRITFISYVEQKKKNLSYNKSAWLYEIIDCAVMISYCLTKQKFERKVLQCKQKKVLLES